MRIAVNAQRLAGQRLGVGRYIEYMLRHWGPMLAADESVTVFVRRPLDRDLDGLHPRIVTHLLDSGMSGIPWENLRLRRAAAGHDVLFCPAYTTPLGYRGKVVVATHSVEEVPEAREPWVARMTRGTLHAHSARRADAVIVPSSSIRDAAVQRYGVSSRRVAVIPQGAADQFRPVTDPATLRAARARFFGPDRPYLLFVGKCSVRRNIPVLLRAFAALRRTQGIPHGLVLFGPNHVDLPLAQLAGELGIQDDLIQTDGVVAQHSDLVPIYAAADLFVHPSSYEGWSITTVEAMACGTPVVAADRGGLGEVARGHAMMVPDPTVQALVEAIGAVLADPDLRRDLSSRARQRGAALDWAVGTRATLDVLRQVARGHSPHEGLSS